MGMKPAMRPFSTSVNKQFDYDHKEDMALWLDKAYVEYRLECMHNALERMKNVACKCGGPAVIEIFGEEPFVSGFQRRRLRTLMMSSRSLQSI